MATLNNHRIVAEPKSLQLPHFVSNKGRLSDVVLGSWCSRGGDPRPSLPPGSEMHLLLLSLPSAQLET